MFAMTSYCSYFVVLTVAACAGDDHEKTPPHAAPVPIDIPGGNGGIGFDDLQFSVSLGRVLVPAGRTGVLALVDPATNAIETIPGFSAREKAEGGHGFGTTSATEGAGFLFAIDRTAMKLDVVDPKAKKIVADAPLGGGPDYVRFVLPTRELWVTEPDAESIEIFALPNAEDGKPPVPHAVATIKVPGGPESLVIDGTRGRAYTHLWKGGTVSIDLKERKIIATWKNGCDGSRGIALDEARGFLFVGCAEGRAAVLDVVHDGKELSNLTAGDGVDIIDYDSVKRHLYFPGGNTATMAILGVSETGELSLLATVPTAKGSHCVTTDKKGHAFVGDPKAGRILAITDVW